MSESYKRVIAILTSPSTVPLQERLAAVAVRIAEDNPDAFSNAYEQEYGVTISPANPPWIAEARALYHGDNLVGAVKLVREHTGMGLKEAKDYVEINFKKPPK